MDLITAYYLILSIEKQNKKANVINIKKNIKPLCCNICGQNMYWCLCKYK